MALNTTMSKDDRKRVDLRVTHRLDADDFALALCYSRQSDDLDELPDLSAKEILAEVRTILRYHGREFVIGWSDDLEPEEANTIRNWATLLVRRRFPEFL